MITEQDKVFLRRAVALAEEALAAGDEPFGSILVSASGDILCEERNRVHTRDDPTQHPEFALTRWAMMHLSAAERANATVYTSGEHCPMCSAAHGWVGLGRIVYASSAAQLEAWLREWQVPAAPIRFFPITDMVPGLMVEGPEPLLAQQVKALHRQRFE